METAEARTAMINAIIASTKPEKTGQFCFDGFVWDDMKPILELQGDFDTPSFRLEFYAGGKVNVVPVENPSWAIMLNSTFSDFSKLAQDILAAMLVVCICSGRRLEYWE